MSKELEHEQIFAELAKAANFIPSPFYWLDNKGKVLGVNDLCLIELGGLEVRNRVVGANNHSFYPEDIAKVLIANNKKVLELGHTIKFEEKVVSLITGEERHVISVRSPLRDNEGVIFGIVGVSVDIADKKEKAIDAIFREIERFANTIPTPLYWVDTKGIVVGINDATCFALGGLDARDKIVGHDHYNFYPKDVADAMIANNEKVLESGQTIEFEEESRNILTGITKYFTSIRSPLRDNYGNIIGIIGTSIEITDKKEKQAQIVREQEHEKFRESASQLIHDMKSPLAGINRIVLKLENGQELTRQDRVTLRSAHARIDWYSHQFMRQYTTGEIETNENKELLVSLALTQIMNEKISEYEKFNIDFNVKISREAAFIFIKLNSSLFGRMISNLVNNAVDALKGCPDPAISVLLSYMESSKKLRLVIRDNGPGMPEHIQEKFKAGISVTEGKEQGHGLGLTQIRNTIQAGNGELDIYVSDTLGGTKISIWFDAIPASLWIAPQIKLTKDDLVIVLDDDASMHGTWRDVLDPIIEQVPTIQVKHYECGQDVVNYINGLTSEQKKDVFLLSDYELVGQGLDGIVVIEKTNMRRAILVTSYSHNQDIHTKVIKHGVTLLPKDLISYAKILVNHKIEKWSRKVDMVWLEDQAWYVDGLRKEHYSHLAVDVYYDPIKFMEYIDQYPLDTRIILDTYYLTQSESLTQNAIKFYADGFQLAKELHEAGYTKIILLAGEPPKHKVPDYITVLLKGDAYAEQNLDKY